jgi:polysaccharide export outer membrane protein
MNLSLLLFAALTLQNPSPASPPSAPQPPASPPARTGDPSSYVIGSQDLLSITVYDEPDLTNRYRVDDAGFVSFPLISRIVAAGSTLAEFEDRLRTTLASGYLRNPQVRVDVEQYRSQSVVVTGSVRAPQKLTMSGSSMTLLEALALAGSPTAEASNEVIVTRRTRDGANPEELEEIRVNRRDLELGRSGRDVLLRDGDIIHVPTAQRFYMDGHVRNPGTFVLDPGMTVQQAIALAGGLSERGSDRGIVARRLVDGRMTDVRVRPDDKVQAGDTIVIRQRFF